VHGCTDPYTQIIVTVDSDLHVPSQLDALKIDVFKDTQTGAPSWTRPTALSEDMLPLSLALNSEDGKARWVTVRVQGSVHTPSGQSVQVVERVARARFERGRALRLEIDLLSSCAASVADGRVVHEAVACPAQQTCGEHGMCEPVTRASLPEYSGLPAKRPERDAGAGPSDAGEQDSQITSAEPDAGPGEPDAGPQEDDESVVGFALGTAHSCALKHSGAVYCWGSNKGNALGRSFDTDPTCPEGSVCRTPRRVPKIYTAVSVAAGDQFACALDLAGSVHCWGDNSVGQLGPTIPEKSLAEPAIVFKKARALGVGKAFVCVVDQDSNVLCWGDASRAQIGLPVDGTEHDAPHRVLAGAAQVALGAAHGCAVLREGGLRCWGDNSTRQLGMTDPSRSADPVVFAATPTLLALGDGHTCFASADKPKRLMCVGRMNEGQLGPNTMQVPGDACPDPDPPGAGVSNVACTENLVPVDLDAPPLALSLGGLFSCALLDDEGTGREGRVVCWGDNRSGQLNDSAQASSSRPASIAIPNTMRVLGTGARHACAADGSAIWCWGANEAGQLGLAAKDRGVRSLPVKVTLPHD
jgi:alpha-tubulin suppressor-like RCC1 family protein